MCDAAFAEWLVWNVEAAQTETTDDHTTIRTHELSEEAKESWEASEAGQLITGYIPRSGAWYVTTDPAVGPVQGSAHFDSEDQAIAEVERRIAMTTTKAA